MKKEEAKSIRENNASKSAFEIMDEEEKDCSKALLSTWGIAAFMQTRLA